MNIMGDLLDALEKLGIKNLELEGLEEINGKLWITDNLQIHYKNRVARVKRYNDIFVIKETITSTGLEVFIERETEDIEKAVDWMVNGIM